MRVLLFVCMLSFAPESVPKLTMAWANSQPFEPRAYPTAYIVWPSYYVWFGTMSVPGASGCLTAPEDGSTVMLASSIDITEWLYGDQDPKTISDSRGLSFQLISADDASNLWGDSTLMSFFSDQPALTLCTNEPVGGPDWGVLTTSWWTLTSTTYVGYTPVAPTASPLPTIKSTGPAISVIHRSVEPSLISVEPLFLT
jgi:hypothetical protein